jgi:hypothetical protein
LPKDLVDASGNRVRVSFGQFLGKPLSSIPRQFLDYLGRDAMAHWYVFQELHSRIKQVFQHAGGTFGWVQGQGSWLRDVIRRFGPLTHHIQLRAAILVDVLRATGVGVEQDRAKEKERQVEELAENCKERMRRRGYLAGQKGSSKAMQSILSELKRRRPQLELATTETGKWSTAEEDLAGLAAEDNFFTDYLLYRTCEKLLSTYLRKMGRPRLYPRFGYLLATGRTYCGGGFNLQNLPTERGERDAAATVRGCFVPAEGSVFIDADFGQIELVTLAYALQEQLGLGSGLADLINRGQDVHRLIAAAVLNKRVEDVTKSERDSAKPVSFGRPGGMGPERLQGIAKNTYGVALEFEEVERRIEAYHTLCPELTRFLQDEVDAPLRLAERLALTPAAYRTAIGGWCDPVSPENQAPAPWVGAMLLKVLREESPVTKQGKGRPYSADELDFFWERAAGLCEDLERRLGGPIVNRRPSRKLAYAVRDLAGRRPVFTATGRLRANATFCASRNTIFQGLAADGAILALWLVWRAGHKIVSFVHDQIIVESPADERVWERASQIEKLMKQGMGMVVPRMKVKVETVITRSLNKQDQDLRYAARPGTG